MLRSQGFLGRYTQTWSQLLNKENCVLSNSSPRGRWNGHWAIEQAEIPDKIKALANKAKEACEKLLKEGPGLIKQGYQCLSAHVQNLSNLLMFAELPDGVAMNYQSLQAFVGKIALDVQNFHVELQAAKARNKAKAWAVLIFQSQTPWFGCRGFVFLTFGLDISPQT